MAKRKKEISSFGQYLTKIIAETDMNKSDFYSAIGINKPSFYEILTGAPSTDTLEKMIVEIENSLGRDEERKRKLYDLAAECRNEIPADIYEQIKLHPENWAKIRCALADIASI